MRLTQSTKSLDDFGLLPPTTDQAEALICDYSLPRTADEICVRFACGTSIRCLGEY